MSKNFITSLFSHTIGFAARKINDNQRDKRMKIAQKESFEQTGKIMSFYNKQGKYVNGSKLYKSIQNPKTKKINRDHELKDDFLKKL